LTHWRRQWAFADAPCRPQRQPAAQLDHQRADLGKGQCGVMHDLAHLAALGQQGFKVPSPACRVLALAKAAGCRPVEHGFDPAAHAGCGLGLGLPDRFEHPHHQCGVDRHHRQLAEQGQGKIGQRLAPLPFLSGATPAGRLCRDVLLGGALEKDDSPIRRPAAAPARDVEGQPPRGALARGPSRVLSRTLFPPPHKLVAGPGY
jgi:hypothetical protein